jgi:hypothetical protein
MPIVVRMVDGVPVVAIEGDDDRGELIALAGELLQVPHPEAVVVVDVSDMVLSRPALLCRSLDAWHDGGTDVRVVCRHEVGRRRIHRVDPTGRLPVFATVGDATGPRMLRPA